MENVTQCQCSSKHHYPRCLQSWAGSIGCGVSGLLASFLFVLLFRQSGYLILQDSISSLAVKLCVVSGTTCFVESVPLKDWDNLTVGLAAAAASWALLG